MKACWAFRRNGPANWKNFHFSNKIRYYNVCRKQIKLGHHLKTYQIVQKVPEVQKILVAPAALGFLKDLKVLMDPVALLVHLILLLQVDQVVHQILKIPCLHLVQEIQVVLVVLVILMGLEDLD